MSDLDRLGDAVERVSEQTVAPPFGTIEHRARARQRRQVAGVALGVAGVLAAGTLAAAIPGGGRAAPLPVTSGGDATAATTHTPTPSPSPPEVFVNAVDGTSESAKTAKCWDVPAPAARGTRTLAKGARPSRSWHIVTWQHDGTNCVGWQTDPAVEPLSLDLHNDSGPDGALVQKLSWDIVESTAKESAIVWWGAVSPEVARVEFLVGGERQSFDTVDGGDRSYVAILLEHPKGTEVEGPFGYDAEGRPVTLPEPKI